jgi:hypothetical protein
MSTKNSTDVCHGHDYQDNAGFRVYAVEETISLADQLQVLIDFASDLRERVQQRYGSAIRPELASAVRAIDRMICHLVAVDEALDAP